VFELEAAKPENLRFAHASAEAGAYKVLIAVGAGFSRSRRAAVLHEGERDE
jgi:hypothetical protein